MWVLFLFYVYKKIQLKTTKKLFAYILNGIKKSYFNIYLHGYTKKKAINIYTSNAEIVNTYIFVNNITQDV